MGETEPEKGTVRFLPRSEQIPQRKQNPSLLFHLLPPPQRRRRRRKEHIETERALRKRQRGRRVPHASKASSWERNGMAFHGGRRTLHLSLPTTLGSPPKKHQRGRRGILAGERWNSPDECHPFFRECARRQGRKSKKRKKRISSRGFCHSSSLMED